MTDLNRNPIDDIYQCINHNISNLTLTVRENWDNVTPEIFLICLLDSVITLVKETLNDKKASDKLIQDILLEEQECMDLEDRLEVLMK